jgi:hypothetical protein
MAMPASAALAAYCAHPFDPAVLPPPPVLPQPDEPHVAVWREYARAANGALFECLQARLVQLCVPIRAGISATPEYAALLRRGEPFDAARAGGRLALTEPGALRLDIVAHPAGALPVLATPCREDFLTLCRALAYRSEPAAIGPMVNAQMIAGVINWDRVGRYRAGWIARGGDGALWPAEMQRVAREERERFFDRLILLCDGPYAGVAAADLGLDVGPAEWVARSATLRTEHELAHYATKRLYGSMRLNLCDELIADCLGMTAALADFRARWFLTCLGLDGEGTARAGARAFTYRQDLDDDDFAAANRMAVRAAGQVERFVERVGDGDRGRLLLALTQVPFTTLADGHAAQALEAAWARSGSMQ